MSLKPFPGLCSSTDSPVHCWGLYNNVLLLFCVNICYSAFFLPPTFLPVHCQRRVIWMKPFWEILPFAAASLTIICQATSTGLEGAWNVEILPCVPGVPAAHPEPAHSPVQRQLCHISGHGCGGFWAGTWLYSSWVLLLPVCMAGQVRLSVFASGFLWHKGLGKCLWVKLLALVTKTSRSRSGERALPTLPTDLFIPGACETLWDRDKAAMVSGKP